MLFCVQGMAMDYMIDAVKNAEIPPIRGTSAMLHCLALAFSLVCAIHSNTCRPTHCRHGPGELDKKGGFYEIKDIGVSHFVVRRCLCLVCSAAVMT